MESLRKYLGYIVFIFVAVAAAVGVIVYVTEVGEVFKAVHDFDSFMLTLFPWLARVICWTIIAIMAIVATVKLGNLDAPQRDNKCVKFVVVGALAEFLAMLALIIVMFKINASKYIPGKAWALLVVTALVLVAAIVRKVSFAQNNLVSKIMAAALALVMFVVMIISSDGAAGKGLVVFILWIIGYALLTAHPLLSSPLKQ